MAFDFSMPAEWMPHVRTWMAWTCRREAWDGPDGLAHAKNAYAAVARAISRFESVVILARPEDAMEAGQVT
ncbi:MAG TPA: agmatine deiminase family protein, partial [Rhizomicrobium sp.]|nr:agmatine deiminase family protein [Rhizomicrobium sp.]